jgi:hypothetical protein
MSTGPRRLASRFAAWSRTDASVRPMYAVAGAIGLLAFMIVFGPGHLVGTSSHWDMPLQDSRAYLMGYRYFLHEPWHWPVFVTHTMNVPYTKSIAFTDSIPLWALINKSIATVVPPWGTFTERAYLGLWYGVVWIAQPCLGVACLRTLGHRSWFAGLVTALFFIAVPAWTLRHVHASLSAHFLLLWALLLYLKSTVGGAAPSRKLRIAQLAQLGVSAMINPYHAVFSFGLFLASVVHTRRLVPIALWAPAGIAAIGIAAWFAGYFAPEAKLAVGGFDVASANALTLVMPFRSGLVGSSWWKDATGYQYEGVAFLGFGILVLLVAYLPKGRDAWPTIKRHPFLLVLAVAAGVFSLSNHVFIGRYELVSFAVPHRFQWVAEQFRCPGRFVWVPMYVLIVFVLHRSLTRFTAGWQRAIVVGLALLQLIDVTGDWRVYRENTTGAKPTYVKVEAWRPLVHAHRAVYVLPSYDCVLDGTPSVDQVSLDIQFLASEKAIPINGVYSARPTRDCQRDAAALMSLTPADDTLYVVLRRVLTVSERLELLGASCGEFEFGRACSRNAAAIEQAIAAGGLTPVKRADLPSVAVSTKLMLADPATAAGLDAGWSYPETWGRWTDGPGARLEFKLIGDIPAEPSLVISLATPLCGARKSADVDVLLDTVPLGTLHFDGATNDPNRARVLPIRDPKVFHGSAVLLELVPHDVRRPNDIACNADTRHLGASVQWIEVQ